MAYKEPKPFVKVNDTILVNSGQEVELQEREIAGELNPNFVVYRNASCRVYLKNGQRLRILAEIDGVVDRDNPLAIAKAACEPLERQTIFVRTRIEPPTEDIPTEPEVIN